MKNFKFLIFAILLIAYSSFMCSGKVDKKQTDDHKHDEAGHTHSHGDCDDPDHDHSSEKDYEPQVIDGEDHDHTSKDTDDHDHDHDTTDLLTISKEWERLIGLQTSVAINKPIELLISVPGKIVPNQNQVAIISPFIESSVNCVFKNIGDKVKKGDMLACLSSPEVGMLRAEYDKAKAELEIEKQTFARKEKLFKEKIIPEKSFKEAELRKKVADVNYNYTLKTLLSIGIKKEEIDNPPTEHTDAVGSTIHIYAPISGVITHREASIGQKVNQSSTLFEIINLKNVWLEADIFEKDLTKIKINQTVKVILSAYQNETFTGKIFYIGNTLNHETKTIKILVEINNPEAKLKPGMFANTNIVVGKKENTLVIPKDAILEDENLSVVFVKEGESYHRHVVTTGIVSNEYIEILSGINAGSVVVTKGNYQLKSKLKMSGIDPHAGHSH